MSTKPDSDKPSADFADLRELVRPPGRADARENYERLLEAAGAVFEADGPDASLDEIARRAGVGNATLYRHFPNREALLVTVCVGEVESLCALGQRLQGAEPPARALGRWLGAFIDHVTSKRGLAAALMSDPGGSEAIGVCNAAIARTATALLEDAQAAGSARADLSAADLLGLVNAIAAASESDSEGRARRLLALALDGIAARGALEVES